MPFPTAVAITAGTQLYLQRSLPNRVLPIITLTTTALVAIGATQIAVAAVVPAVGLGSVAGDVIIQQGDKLTFNSTIPTIVTVTKDVKAGDLFVECLPTLTAIQSGNTATSNGFLLLLGADDLSFKISEQTVKTTSFESGIYTEEQKVRLGGEVSLNGFFRIGDPCAKQVLLPAANSLDLEVAFKLVYPTKEFKSGFAILKGYEEGGKLDQIRTYKGTLMFNGTFQQGTIA